VSIDRIAIDAEVDMARNPIQFGKGLSLSEFQESYGTEEQCRQAVVAWRWPNGFVCPACGGRDHAIVGKRRLYLCHGCRKQTSVIAGTVFENSLLPLTKWFQATWLITQSKNSISTLELSRQIGVKWDTAWRLRQKLASVISEVEAGRTFKGRIEMDDAVLGGEKSETEGGKRGRGGANKVPFVVAVETTAEGRPRRVLLHLVERHDSTAIEAMARKKLTSGTHVISDGLGCFRAVTRAGASHTPIVSAREPEQPEKIPALKWVNTVLGNLKTAIAGTHKAVRRPYVERYFAEFQFRFNGRHDLPGLFTGLLAAAAGAQARTHADIRLA
jgi:transposase-like protein